MKALALFLQEINGGTTHAACTAELFKTVQETGRKGALKYRLGNGGVKFWYELDRPERAIEDAFAGYVKEVQEQSGYSVLIGSPDKS